MFAGWPWSLDMAGTLGSTQRAWWWVVLMPLVQGNSGNRFSRMWVGLKFLPVFVSNSLVHDGSLWKGSFFILLNKNSRILLPFLSRCDFCRICRAFTKARRQRIIKERERWRDVTKVCRQTDCRGFNYQLILVLFSASKWAFELSKNVLFMFLMIGKGESTI